MNISKACVQILDQLADVVHQLTPSDFSKPSEALSQSTVGQHLRHTLEFFICFEQGFERGVINYDRRAHDKEIESDKYLALSAIRRITAFVESLGENKPLTLEVSYDLKKEDFATLQTNAIRELVYNIEHAVHHMAIMKIGIREIAPYVKLPSDFGVAASTIRFKETVSVQR